MLLWNNESDVIGMVCVWWQLRCVPTELSSRKRLPVCKASPDVLLEQPQHPWAPMWTEDHLRTQLGSCAHTECGPAAHTKSGSSAHTQWDGMGGDGVGWGSVVRRRVGRGWGERMGWVGLGMGAGIQSGKKDFMGRGCGGDGVGICSATGARDLMKWG